MFKKYDDVIAAEQSAIAKMQGLIEWLMVEEDVSEEEFAKILRKKRSYVSNLLGNNPKGMTIKSMACVIAALDDEIVITSKRRLKYLEELDKQD